MSKHVEGPMTGKAGVYDYPLRAHITVTGIADEVEIGFAGWDDAADWLASPGRWRLGHIETITITWATNEHYRKDAAA